MFLRSLIYVLITFSTLASSRFSFAQEPSQVFQGGAATSNITPPLGEMIVGGWAPIPASNIHDELHARCIVLDDGQSKLAIVLCDNVGIPEEVFDLAKQQVVDATKIPKSHLLMASTHTHSATTARGPGKVRREEELTEYQTFLARRISDSVRRALANLEPAKIAWGSVEEPSEVFNRRWFVTNAALLGNPFGGIDQVRMNPPRGNDALDRPAGPIDPEVSFVSVQSVDGRPIALLANYSLHYVGGVRPGDVSADYFGYFARYIEQKLCYDKQEVGDAESPPFVGILSNGTSGDVNNINFTERSPKKRERYEKMREVAMKVATRVHEAHADLHFQDWVKLDAVETRLPLQVRQPTAEMLAHFEKREAESAKDPKSGHRRETIYAERIAGILESPRVVEVPLQAIRLGDLAIAAIPFETFTETGLEIKDLSPFGDTFTIELAGGSFGYLPTPRQHRLGGYETWLGTNFVEIEASNKITSSILDMFKELRGKE